MAILGTLLKKGIQIREMLEEEYTSPLDLQKKELKELLINARQTEFGKYYNFSDILKSFRTNNRAFYKHFKKNVPIHSYNKIYSDWWRLALKGVKNMCWPGRVKYFALSSGTSEASSKYIPVTKDM
ncbi:MAG: GH3 auxin-responsive promoter family protein, partial [Flammeovirgaceae bacterium]|nr:GH3 auxin-responsive promoter family protein [Flammeovirgaceae bacterium]